MPRLNWLFHYCPNKTGESKNAGFARIFFDQKPSNSLKRLNIAAFF
jgi:hypothetical protein